MIRDEWQGGFWTLVDQEIVSLGSFFVTVLATRTMSQRDLGTYTLVYSAILFFNTIHGALIVYPMFVRGATLGEGEMCRLTACSFVLAGGLNVALSVLLVACFVSFADLATLAIAVPLMLAWQLQETLRRSFMARLDHRGAILGDSLTYLGAPVVCLALALDGRLSLDTVLGASCLCFCAGAIAHARHARFAGFSYADLRQCADENCLTGRWLLLTNIVNVAGIQILPWALAYWHGLAATATMRAVINFGMVTHPILFSLGNIVVPSVARSGKQLRKAARIAATHGAQAAALLFPYFVFLCAIPGVALALAYGRGSPYLECTNAVRLVVVFYTAMLLGQIFEALLRGLERTREIFIAQFVVIGATIFVSLPLTYAFGVTGALLGNCVAMTAVLAWYVAKLSPSSRRWAAQAALIFAGEGK